MKMSGKAKRWFWAFCYLITAWQLGCSAIVLWTQSGLAIPDRIVLTFCAAITALSMFSLWAKEARAALEEEPAQS